MARFLLAATALLLAHSAAAFTLGPQKLAVIAFRFQNDPTPMFTIPALRALTFTDPDSLRGFYLEESEGLISVVGKTGNVDGDVYGWVTIPYDLPSDCDELSDWHAAARSIAEAEDGKPTDGDLDGYDHYLYVMLSAPRVLPRRLEWHRHMGTR